MWLCWYLAVALVYDAHNNEAAGAVRIESYKQIIRFRLTPTTLTGYVIAVDEPQTSLNKLEPKLVDVFTVRCGTPP